MGNHKRSQRHLSPLSQPVVAYETVIPNPKLKLLDQRTGQTVDWLLAGCPQRKAAPVSAGVQALRDEDTLTIASARALATEVMTLESVFGKLVSQAYGSASAGIAPPAHGHAAEGV